MPGRPIHHGFVCRNQSSPVSPMTSIMWVSFSLIIRSISSIIGSISRKRALLCKKVVSLVKKNAEKLVDKINFITFAAKLVETLNNIAMYWTLELASKLEDAPWPATKEELLDYATRSGAPLEVLENLQEIEDEGDVYESIEDIWPDYPSKDDFLWNDDEY